MENLTFEITEGKIKGLSAVVIDKLKAEFDNQLSAQAGHYQKVASAAQAAAAEAKATLDALTQRSEIVRSELAEMDKRLAAKRAAWSALYPGE